MLIGLFWPSMMALRARYVPEEQRSTIINIFRIPLNAFVCIILWKVGAPRGAAAAVALVERLLVACSKAGTEPKHRRAYHAAHPKAGGASAPPTSPPPKLRTHPTRAQVSDFPLGVIFGLCCLFLAAAALAQARLAAITAPRAYAAKSHGGAGALDAPGGGGGSGGPLLAKHHANGHAGDDGGRGGGGDDAEAAGGGRERDGGGGMSGDGGSSDLQKGGTVLRAGVARVTSGPSLADAGGGGGGGGRLLGRQASWLGSLLRTVAGSGPASP